MWCFCKWTGDPSESGDQSTCGYSAQITPNSQNPFSCKSGGRSRKCSELLIGPLSFCGWDLESRQSTDQLARRRRRVTPTDKRRQGPSEHPSTDAPSFSNAGKQISQSNQDSQAGNEKPAPCFGTGAASYCARRLVCYFLAQTGPC